MLIKKILLMLDIEFVRYTLASALAFVVDVSLFYWITTLFDISYLVSNAMSFSLGVLIVYVLSIKWVFTHRKFENAWAEFSTFAIIGLAGLAVSEIFLYAFIGMMEINLVYSKVASSIFVFLWNYSIRKWLIFNG